MKPSLRGATHFATAYPAARIATRLARMALVLALIFAAALPSSAGDPRRPRPAVGTVFGWGNDFPNSPTELSGLSGVVAVADGRHSLFLKSDGTVMARGWNDFGQLGDGTITPGSVQTPAPVSGLSDVVAIAVGKTHSIALKSDGTVWTWGRNDDGQLGVEGGDQSTPVQVTGLSGMVAIAAGERHSLALKCDGTVWAWGFNGWRQLGVSGPPGSVITPVQVPDLSGMVAIEAGNTHSVALSSDGTVWAWGGNQLGELGRGGVWVSGGEYPLWSSTPQPVMGGAFSGVTKISSSVHHTLAVKSDGTVWAWGENDLWGRLGNGGTTSSGTPVQAVGLSDIVAVAGGSAHSVALKGDGTVWTWGYNGDGQLGIGMIDADPHLTATQVPGLSGVVAIFAGIVSSMALQSQAMGAAWGSNTNGYLGNNTVTRSTIPTAVNPLLTGLSAISAGGFHSVAVKSDGTLWTWGYNGYGEMGIGEGLSGGSTPTQILVAGPRVKAVATGEHHTLALTSTGAVWAWGENENGQTGVGTVGPTGWVTDIPVSYLPVQVDGILPVVAVAAGAYHSLALDSGGTVWAWGANNQGQLGTPPDPYTSRSAPGHVQGETGTGYLSGVVAIAAGGLHSLALKNDGTVWAWGSNSNGELGNGQFAGPQNPTRVPVQVIDPANPSGYLTGVVAIAAGTNFSLALKADGTVWAWGNNGIGQLGNSTVGTASRVPVPVQATDATHYLAGVITIAASYQHALALKSNGVLLAWGWNSQGQLGNGTSTSFGNYTPVHVLGPQAPSVVSAGYVHSLALGLAPTLGAEIAGYITITADNQAITYGNAVPTLNYSVTPGVDLGTLPICTTTATSASPVGTYPITCSGASGTGYLIDYVPGTLTVNPAPLIVTADNKSMAAWGSVPALTASYLGLVSGDTPTQMNSSVTLSTNAPPSPPAGTYLITVTVAPLTNYTVITQPGTLTVNPALLNLKNNHFVTGDFAVGYTVLRGQGDGSGFATGEIRIPNVGLPDPANTVPAGADIVAAYLYWQAVEWSGIAPAANGAFRSYPITGERLGSDLAFAPSPAPAGGGTTVMRMYRANVLPYLPMDGDGRRLPAGPHAVRLPEGGTVGDLPVLPLSSGASLVVIYRVLSPDFPLKAVVLCDGAWVKPTGLELTIRGFYDAKAGATTRLFNMASTDNAFVPNLMTGASFGGSSFTETIPAVEGTAGGVQVYSVAVNDTDNDGLLDAWELAGGYNEVSDDSWVPLTGADIGQKDMFVQLDYMCSGGTCDPANSRLPQLDPATGQDPLLMVQQAFDASGIKLHYLIGHAIQEETCQDDLTVGPPRLCQFPGEPGVVGWKTGLEVFKAWPRDPAACVANGDCTPRFARGQKDSYHYVLFGNSLAVAAWNTRARTLESIVVSGGQATITTPHRVPLNGSTCPTRVTISGALGAPALNGVYNVSGCGGSDTTLTISTPGVGDWSYTKPALPAQPGSEVIEPEPLLAVTSGNISSISGYSELGGANSAVTLGKWETSFSQNMGKKPNVQAGTLMHELGHTIGLAHGGAYADTPGSYALTFGTNCKPNYQSIMNYMFQVDLLPGNVLAFSGPALDTMGEGSGAYAAGTARFPQTRWYVPWSPTDLGSPATRHCDGTAILDNAQMVREDHSISTMAWTGIRDVNFNGQSPENLRGYDDLPNIDLRQVGAAGAEYVSVAELLGFGSGHTFNLGSGGNFNLGAGGNFNLGAGGNFNLGAGGNFNLGAGGNFNLGAGGNFNLGAGGNFNLGAGGNFNMGAGGNFNLGAGGTLTNGDWNGTTLTLGAGGGFTLGVGGNFNLGAGGNFNLGAGGNFDLGAGGNFNLGAGGNFNLGAGGNFNLGAGGNFNLGAGGNFNLGAGGNYNMGAGGTFGLGVGGNYNMGSGGNFNLGAGGNFNMGSGGNFNLGAGGIDNMGSGGVIEEMTYETANSVVRPPSEVTMTPTTGGGLRIDWEPPSFGVVFEYHVYYRVGSGTPVAVGTVPGDPPPTTFTVYSLVAGAAYFVTTTVAADSESTTPRSSPPSDPAVLKYDQTITFGVLPDKLYGEAAFGVSATASPSGLLVSFSAAGNCTVSDDLVSLTGVGSCTITASQRGGQGYNPAPSVSRTFEILETQKNQAISFSALPNKAYGDPDFTVTAAASSGLPVTFSPTGNCTVNGATVHLSGVGSCTVTASQEGNNVYKPAPPVPQTFTIIAWTIQGFHAPVSMPQNGTPVWNVVKGGSTRPLKFNIYAGAVEQTALSAVNGGSVALYTVGCQPGDATELAAEIDNTGSTSLRYDGTQFIQNWKTPKKANVCYAVRMTARDGSAITGYFRTK
jgi:alpha-tubulin suppressor-like RCC1 family protein/uncharacterized protein (DUF2345 family)